MVQVGVLMPLGTVLREVESAPWTHALFIRGPRPWTAASVCSVLDHNEPESPEDDPAFAKEAGLAYALIVPDVRDVVGNCMAQKPDASEHDLVKALNYYFEHDAFLDWGTQAKR